MDPDRLRLLLRQRAEALAPATAVLDRALARCARMGVRQAATSGRQSTPTQVTVAASTATPTAVTVPSQPPSAAATVVSQPPSSSGVAPVTVPSLGTAAPAAAVPAGQLAPGTIIAGYRIEGLLGKGGMGAVYRATQLSMNRPVAFKVLAARFADDPTFVGRFRREARAAGRLHHPNLVTVHDSGEADGAVFFSMELVEGASLKTLIKERGRLPPEEALRLGRQALEGLAYAHGKGVVHRDIKPDNLMLTAAGQIKIADLGLSRIEDGKDPATSDLFRTEVGSFMGTPHYMAPEQGRDAHTADQRSDLYALGATLYHLICGRPPYNGTTPMEVLIAAQSQPLAWPDPPPPPPVRELLGRLLEKDPARRPADAQAALAAFDRLLVPHGAPLPAVPRRRWRGMLLTAVGVVIAVVTILAALRFVDERRRQRDWEAERTAAQSLAADRRYADALERLHRVRAGFADGSPRAAACETAIAETGRQWDAWAVPQVAGVERAVRDHLAAGRVAEGLAALRKVPDAWRSPEAERKLEALQREWEEAAARDASKRPEGAAKGLLDEWRERRVEAWRKARIEPPEALQLRDGAAVFVGSGRGRLPAPGPGHLGATSLRLIWRGDAKPGSEWRLETGISTFVLRADGATLGGKPVARSEDGSFGLLLMRGPQGAYLATRGRDGPLTLPLPPGDPQLVWNLGGAEVEAVLGGRGQRGPGPGGP